MACPLIGMSACGRFHCIKNITLHKKWSFPSKISSANVTTSAVSYGFSHIYWRNPQWKTSFFVQCYQKTSRSWKINLMPSSISQIRIEERFETSKVLSGIFDITRCRYNQFPILVYQFWVHNFSEPNFICRHKKCYSKFHCVKSARIWSYSGPNARKCVKNADQNNAEYGHLLHGVLSR